MEPKDRRTDVLNSPTLNGIDFVEVANDAETLLRVHFLNAVKPRGTISATITGGERIPSVVVGPISDADWGFDDSHLVLTLSVVAPGDFSNYTLALESTLEFSGLDPYFSQSVFSFKARCSSQLDCQAVATTCPPLVADPPPIDYLAKDFLSFRQALLDFSALRYPDWQERSEADFGVMFLEALSGLADDLSYTQDRIAAEASLETATQRRSVVRHARLVDYEPSPATSATVLLQFDVDDATHSITDGTMVSATGPDGSAIVFETGASLQNRLVDPTTGTLLNLDEIPSRTVSSAWNHGVIQPYWFDDSDRCLRAGSTQMYVLGTGFCFQHNQLLLIETTPETIADSPLRQIVQLIDDPEGNAATETCDPLYPPPSPLVLPGAPPQVNLSCTTSPPSGTAVTLLRWGPTDALTNDRDQTRTVLAGNLVAATQGLTVSSPQSQAAPTPGGLTQYEPFAIPPAPELPLNLPRAIVRTGPDDSPNSPSLQYLYTPKYPVIAWLAPATPGQPGQSEVVLVGPDASGEPTVWPYVRWLLDATQFDPAFTLDPAGYAAIAGNGGDTVFSDYDNDAAMTIRFGDGVFGAVPTPGTTFTLVYRAGVASLGNVAAGAINNVVSQGPGILRVTNPLPASGGAEAQTLESVRRLAPQAFRAVQYRAVIPADYEAAAETLPWVQRAGTVFRWTGSWLTVFTTPDPLGSEQITLPQRTALIELLNRYRMAGYESYVPDPNYVSLDLAIQICAQPTAFHGDVEAAVLTALGTGAGGFFNPNNFTFGQPLWLSSLETAVQNAPGVAGVICVRYRIRGRTAGYVPLRDVVTVGVDEIIRCDNDPSEPEHGSLTLIIEGGK
jgi:hypothetical protein